MARGSHGQEIFQDDWDRQRFLETLGEACAKTGFRGNGSRTAGRPVVWGSRLAGLILMRFQDEPNSGRVSAWQDHAGLIHSWLSGRNCPPPSPPLSNPCDNVRRCCCRRCSGPPSNKPPPFWALAGRPCRASKPPSASTSRRCPTLPATGADAGNPSSPKRKKSRF